MQVSSSSNFVKLQANNSKVQQNNSEYLHKALKYDGADKIIEFEDEQSGKLVQFYADQSLEKSFEEKFNIDFSEDTAEVIKATGDFGEYLQKMWSHLVNTTNTKDSNSDGYIDLNEMSNSIRDTSFNYNSDTKEIKFELSSFKELSSSEKEALDNVKKYFQSSGNLDYKISVDEDFNNLMHVDKNLDANIEDIEILASIDTNKLIENESLSISEKKDIYTLSKNWKKKKKEEEEKEEETAAKNVAALRAGFDYFEWLVNSHQVDNDTKSENIDLAKMKENLTGISKYLDTQTNGAKIFSLKI
jgi:hypothetical protein